MIKAEVTQSEFHQHLRHQSFTKGLIIIIIIKDSIILTTNHIFKMLFL